MDINKIKAEFKKIYKTYDTRNLGIIIKYYHSLRVMDLSRLIAKYNSFNDNDAEIAAVVWLLHDYARFAQWTKYRTFSDLKSIDHGDVGVSMLFDNDEIDKYTLNKENYDEIYDAIKYHNKFEVPENLSEHNKLLCKVIRDADKLDIFYLKSINKNLLEEDGQPISAKMENDFFNNRQLKLVDAKSKDDLILLCLAMVFDLNFDYSFEYLLDRNLIWRMYDNIVEKERFKKYFDYIDKYIHERVNK